MLPVSLRAEVLNHDLKPRMIKAAMIDFDGTVSLLREGWDHVMIPMMVSYLQNLPGTSESPGQLRNKVTEWVVKLNGQPTIDQMQALADEVKRRQGLPQPASVYKQQYLKLLMETVNRRKQEVINTKAPAQWAVPGIYQLLEELKRRRMPMLLASGTDLDALREEAALLEVTPFFTEGIAGPESDVSQFTKAKACDEMLSRLGTSGIALLNVGDGYVETRLTKDRGGIAIGVAYDHDRPGEYHNWRREQLVRAGADLILPDLKQSELLLQWLLEGTSL